MSFLETYMFMEVKPLQSKDKPRTGKGNPNPDNRAANLAKRAAADAAYKAILEKGWIRTRDLEVKMGYYQGTALPWLRGREKQGLVESRKVGGEEGHNRSKGFEWRWINKRPQGETP